MPERAFNPPPTFTQREKYTRGGGKSNTRSKGGSKRDQ